MHSTGPMDCRCRQYIILTVVVLLAAFAPGDELILTNGQRVEGKILRLTDDYCTIQTGNMQLRLPRRNIRSIFRAGELDNLIRLGDQLAASHNYSTAIDYYQQALRLQPDSTALKEKIQSVRREQFRRDVRFADLLMKQKQFTLAITEYEKMLGQTEQDDLRRELQIRLSEACSYAAEEAVDKVYYERALQLVKRALEYNPQSSTAHLVMAKYELQRYEDPGFAKKEVELAVASNPKNAFALEQLKQLEALVARPETPEVASLRLPAPTEERIKTAIASAAPFLPAHAKPAQSRSILDNYRGKERDLALLLQAYNAGPGAVVVYGGDVPYRETRNYVPLVINHLKNGLPQTKYDSLISRYAQKYSLDERLVKAIIKVESDFDRREYVARTQACGLMQIVPVDWRDTTKRLRVNWKFDRDVWDPEKNLEVGCHYLAWLRDEFLPQHFPRFQL